MTNDQRIIQYVRLIARMELTLRNVDEQLRWAQSRAVDRGRLAHLTLARNEIAARIRETAELFPVLAYPRGGAPDEQAKPDAPTSESVT